MKFAGTASINMKSKLQNFRISIKCLIIDEILDVVPNKFFSIETWDFPKYLSLTDPQFNVPRSVDLLLGSNVFSLGLNLKH